MIKNEAYWTEEYLLYAQLEEQKAIAAEEPRQENIDGNSLEQQGISQSTGTSS